MAEWYLLSYGDVYLQMDRGTAHLMKVGNSDITESSCTKHKI